MGRSKKIQLDESDIESDQNENTQPQETIEIPLIMSIAELEKLTDKQKQLFRANGGTSTQN